MPSKDEVSGAKDSGMRYGTRDPARQERRDLNHRSYLEKDIGRLKALQKTQGSFSTDKEFMTEVGKQGIKMQQRRMAQTARDQEPIETPLAPARPRAERDLGGARTPPYTGKHLPGYSPGSNVKGM